jgi:hypothetical protein
MPWLRDAYRGAVATWKNDLLKVTVRPFVVAGLFVTGIDAIRAVSHHDFSRVAGDAIVWVFLGPFLYIWWHRNKT